MAALILGSIDLLNPSLQHFSFQKPVINYIFENSSLIFTQKLIKCCKFFKFLHLKINEARIDNLSIWYNSCEVIAGLSKVLLSNQNECFYKIESSMKPIKILNFFKYFCFVHSTFTQNYFMDNLMPKLDFCQTKEIILDTNFVFERETLNKIIQPSLEKLVLNCRSFKDVNPGLLVLQKCPNIKAITIRCFGPPFVPILTKNILKEMLKIKRKNKIERFVFKYVSEIDRDDLIKFMDNHLAVNGFISFFTDAEFNAFKWMFTKIQQKRPKKEHGIKVLLLSRSKSFETIL